VPAPPTEELTAPPAEAWLRERLERLCCEPRPSASEAERRAAEWLVAELRAAGARDARIAVEEEANGTYWWSLGLPAAAGAALGMGALRGGRAARALATIGGAVATALAIDELPPGSRALRRRLPARAAHQVLAEVGPADAERTIVVMAHHDTAHSGLVFNPAIPETLGRIAPWIFERADTSPPLMYPVFGGQALVAAGAALGSRKLLAAGTAVAAGAAAAMADIGMRGAVTGANDNGTAVVALIALARALVERPPESVRVLLLSTSEEALCEGMGLFMKRHAAELPAETTFFLGLDTIGSPHLCVLRGEGMVRVRDYPAPSLELVDGLAEELGIELFPNLRLRNATDGIFPLHAGYQCVSMASCTHLKQPANYHWPTDTPERIDYGTLADAIRLSEAVVRRLDEKWIRG
jgi:hypothetical protein